jgi:prolyl-tRNA synthetase
MIEYYDISGCYILRTWSFRIWEFINNFFDAGIKRMGVQNAYFPLFVTKKALEAEEDHVDGFAAEVAWVTHSGQSKLQDPIAVRPTSETIMYPAFAKWIRSHRDLPLKLNQWTNVVRWEFSNPTPFIRTREFLWQEGHSAFATQEEAEEEVLDILDLYASVYEDLLAIPVTKGKKTELEKFPGGYFTTTVEAFISATGRGLQGATSHCLGTNFAKMFNIQFESKEKKRELCWQNSWGLSTRSIGALVMTHSDDKGLVLPPTVAPIQVVIVPILYKTGVEEMLDKCYEFARELKAQGVRVKVDDDTHHKPGWKYFHWELKGVPLRIELGPRDMKQQTVMLARRDTGSKARVEWADLGATVSSTMTQMYQDMFNKAKREKEERIRQVTTWADFMTAVNSKCVALAPWCGRKACEASIKKRSGEAAEIEEVEVNTEDDTAEAAAAAAIQMTGSAKSLCVPLAQPELAAGTCCVGCEDPAINWTMFGRSY